MWITQIRHSQVKITSMNMQTNRSLGLLLLAVVATACASPSTGEPEGLELIASTETSASSPQLASTETSAAPPQQATSETTASSPQSQFDPGGLSIGPGSGFIVLDDPAVIPASQATWLAPEELILGVAVGDEARAYPISQMAYHHIANDQIGGEPYLVTY